MTDRVRLDLQDKAALRALDSDFVIAADGEVATIAGDMKVEIIRVADERYQLAINFPGGEEFIILLSRDRTLEQLGVHDESVPEQ
jgi:hypothetical protein